MTTLATPAPPTPAGPVLGVDVSKARLDLAFSDGRRPEPLAYDENGLRALLALLRDTPAALVVVESTGGIEQPLLDALLDASVPVARVQPGRVRHFACADAKLAKTDRIDALVLARFGERMAPRLLEKRPEKQTELEALVTCRRQLVQTRTAQQNQRRTVRSKAVLKSIDKILAALAKEIQSLDEQIKKLIDSEDDFRDLDRLMRTVPGVGVGLTAAVLGSFAELGTLGKRQAAALLGVAPFNHDSGRRTGVRRVRGGRVDVRNAFYMSACSARQYNPVIKLFADRLEAAGKPFKKVITACMRKLADYLGVMLRENLRWEELDVVKKLKRTPSPA